MAVALRKALSLLGSSYFTCERVRMLSLPNSQSCEDQFVYYCSKLLTQKYSLLMCARSLSLGCNVCIWFVNPKVSNLTGVGCYVSCSLVDFENEAIGQCCFLLHGLHWTQVRTFSRQGHLQVPVTCSGKGGWLLLVHSVVWVAAAGRVPGSGMSLPARSFSLILGILFS